MWKCAVLLLVVFLTSQGVFSQCKPGENCKAPDCRCWDDPNVPGGLNVKDIPQIVIVSFEYGINRANVDSYVELFDGILNPNGCQAKGTFFVTELNTDFIVVKNLFNEKHEIAMSTPTGEIPLDADEWKKAFADMKAKLEGAGIPEEDILGTRSPELYSGGNDQFDAMVESKLVYDSTCVSIEYSDKNNLIWPYTYDFIDDTPSCTIGETPSQAYPGKWQFLVANLMLGDQKCASPSACSIDITDTQGAFDFFYSAFKLHYEGKTRAPFILYVDPMWLTVDYQQEGTKQFLEFIRTAYTDTWIVTTQQALAWIQDPVSSANATGFQPWDCK